MRLETSQQLLERVRATLGDDVSYYRVSKVIGATDGTIANWRHGRSGIGREYVTRVAELLGERPEYVLACVEHEREQDAGARKLWERIAAKFSSRAASIVLALLAGFGLIALPAQRVAAHATEAAPASVYYGKWRRYLRRLARRVLQGIQGSGLFPRPSVTAPAV